MCLHLMAISFNLQSYSQNFTQSLGACGRIERRTILHKPSSTFAKKKEDFGTCRIFFHLCKFLAFMQMYLLRKIVLYVYLLGLLDHFLLIFGARRFFYILLIIRHCNRYRCQAIFIKFRWFRDYFLLFSSDHFLPNFQLCFMFSTRPYRTEFYQWASFCRIYIAAFLFQLHFPFQKARPVLYHVKNTIFIAPGSQVRFSPSYSYFCLPNFFFFCRIVRDAIHYF